MHFIDTPNAPPPRGHYSQAVVVPPFVFVSGILPIIPGTNRNIPVGIVAQTEQVLHNLAAILYASQSDLQHVVSVQIFLSDLSLWESVNTVYARLLGEHKPARAVIPCAPFNGLALLELTAIAQIIG